MHNYDDKENGNRDHGFELVPGLREYLKAGSIEHAFGASLRSSLGIPEGYREEYEEEKGSRQGFFAAPPDADDVAWFKGIEEAIKYHCCNYVRGDYNFNGNLPALPENISPKIIAQINNEKQK